MGMRRVWPEPAKPASALNPAGYFRNVEFCSELPNAPSLQDWLSSPVPQRKTITTNRDRWWAVEAVCSALEFIMEILLGLLP
jgi:hypothetical protein